MQIKFTVAGPINFTQVWYVLALNTSGTGGQPYAQNGNPQRNWLDFSYEIIVWQVPGGQVQASLFQFVSQPGVGGGTLKTAYGPIIIPPQDFILNANCNGSNTQWCIIFTRNILLGVTASPLPTTSPSSSPSTSPSPTTSPSSTPSPGPTPSTNLAPVWFINWFTVSPGAPGGVPGQIIDAPGLGGPNDTTWLPPAPSNYDTTTTFDQPWTAPGGWFPVSNPAAQIMGGEVLNNP